MVYIKCHEASGAQVEKYGFRILMDTFTSAARVVFGPYWTSAVLRVR